MDQRREHHIDQGDASRSRDGRTFYRRNLLATLREREVASVGAEIAASKALPFRAAVDGETVSGKFTGTVQLSSGKFALIEKSHEFTLVPWRPVIDRQLGREVIGVEQGGRFRAVGAAEGLGIKRNHDKACRTRSLGGIREEADASRPAQFGRLSDFLSLTRAQRAGAVKYPSRQMVESQLRISCRIPQHRAHPSSISPGAGSRLRAWHLKGSVLAVPLPERGRYTVSNWIRGQVVRQHNRHKCLVKSAPGY